MDFLILTTGPLVSLSRVCALTLTHTLTHPRISPYFVHVYTPICRHLKVTASLTAPPARAAALPRWRGGGSARRGGVGGAAGKGKTEASTQYAAVLGRNLSRNEVRRLVHLHGRDPVPLTCKPHLLHFFSKQKRAV